MMDFNPNIAHITCNLCGKHWQVLNEDGTDWDEQASAGQYHAEAHNCQAVAPVAPAPVHHKEEK